MALKYWKDNEKKLEETVDELSKIMPSLDQKIDKVSVDVASGSCLEIQNKLQPHIDCHGPIKVTSIFSCENFHFLLYLLLYGISVGRRHDSKS